MENKKSDFKFVIPSQIKVIKNFMKLHRRLAVNICTSTSISKKDEQLWIELAKLLNAVPEGSQKTWRQWIKVWYQIHWAERTPSPRPPSNVIKTEMESEIDIVEPKLEPLDEDLPLSEMIPPLFSAAQITSSLTNNTVTSTKPPPLTLIPPRLVPISSTGKSGVSTKSETRAAQNHSSSVDDLQIAKENKHKEELINVKWAKVNALERIATALEVLANRGNMFVDPSSNE